MNKEVASYRGSISVLDVELDLIHCLEVKIEQDCSVEKRQYNILSRDSFHLKKNR